MRVSWAPGSPGRVSYRSCLLQAEAGSTLACSRPGWRGPSTWIQRQRSIQIKREYTVDWGRKWGESEERVKRKMRREVRKKVRREVRRESRGKWGKSEMGVSRELRRVRRKMRREVRREWAESEEGSGEIVRRVEEGSGERVRRVEEGNEERVSWVVRREMRREWGGKWGERELESEEKNVVRVRMAVRWGKNLGEWGGKWGESNDEIIKDRKEKYLLGFYVGAKQHHSPTVADMFLRFPLFLSCFCTCRVEPSAAYSWSRCSPASAYPPPTPPPPSTAVSPPPSSASSASSPPSSSPPWGFFRLSPPGWVIN